MALLLTLTSATGYEVQDAYIKVDEYGCYGNTVHARLRACVSKELADNGASSIEGSEDIITLTVDYSDNAANAKKQIYEHVKKLDKYVNSVDI
ncbi:hypothetical protein BSK66_08045 [Paenibacillus odorifer]|uniref:hypothetical protein n=1 Tax=Paenibacillus TaxID=44249 RepID=UPI0003E1BDD9|nr:MULTISPECIES: hypothetical protein [Paenibacillus]ETT64955.1 hypothetical protein C171_08062 [Paenibacillus sp. FSL H8-237]OME61072.1 hypothetical protein BSK66_08045 [Paenibacillus odorifer]